MKRLFCTAAISALTLSGAAAQENQVPEEETAETSVLEDETLEEEEQASNAPTYSQERMATLRARRGLCG